MANIQCSNGNKFVILIYFLDKSKRLLWKPNHRKNWIYGYWNLRDGEIILLHNDSPRPYLRPLLDIIHHPFTRDKQQLNFLWNLHPKLIPNRVKWSGRRLLLPKLFRRLQLHSINKQHKLISFKKNRPINKFLMGIRWKYNFFSVSETNFNLMEWLPDANSLRDLLFLLRSRRWH